MDCSLFWSGTVWLLMNLLVAVLTGIVLEVRWRAVCVPRRIALIPILALTLFFGLLLLARILLYWVWTRLWCDPPTLPSLLLTTSVILSWAVTGLLIIVDRHRNG